MMFKSGVSHLFRSLRPCFFTDARFWAASLLLAMLSGCGGGGSSSTSANFTLSTQQLSFVADHQGSLPAEQTIKLSWSDPEIAGFAYVFTSSNPQPGWLDFDPVISNSPVELVFSINTTNMSPGTYQATLPLYSGDISENPLAHKNITVTYTIRDVLMVAPASLDFEYAIGQPSNPDSQTLALGGQSINWTASTNASWLFTGKNSGSAPGSLSVSVDPDGMPAGNYTATLTLAYTGSSDPVAVPVSLTVSEPALATGQSSLTFSGVNGGSIASSSVSIAMNNDSVESWAASSNQGWLMLNKTSGTTPDSLVVSVDPSVGPLTSGSHMATISLSSSTGGVSLNSSIPVTLNLSKATLTLNPASLVLGGSDGLDESTQSVSIALDTDSNAYPWTAQLTGEWLSADKTTGNASGSADQITLDGDRGLVIGGTYQGAVEISVDVNGDTIQQTLPVVFNHEAHKLFIADNGVAMVSIPGITHLSRSLKVKDTLGKTTPWAASSDQSWLSATTSGLTGDDLVLTADTTGLTPDQLYLASVTVSSSDTTVENTETVRVGLWLGSSAPNAIDAVNSTYSQIKADPVRPYVYVHNGGTDIDIYNIYTGSLINTVSSVGTQLGNMTISKDGSTLYVMDTSNQTLLPLNLDSYSTATGWPISGSYSDPYLTYTRVAASDYVLASNGHVYAVADGLEQPATFVSRNVLASSRNGDTLCGVNQNVSPYTLKCYRLSYSALNGGLFELTANTSFTGFNNLVASNGGDVAISADGSRVYVASGAPYAFLGYDFDGSALTGVQILAGEAYPNNVEISDNDQLYAGASVWYGDHATNDDEIWVYEISSGNKLFSNYVSGYAKNILARQLVVSGDGVRSMMLTNDPKLVFMTAP